jgi:hypothetical protein
MFRNDPCVRIGGQAGVQTIAGVTQFSAFSHDLPKEVDDEHVPRQRLEVAAWSFGQD